MTDWKEKARHFKLEDYDISETWVYLIEDALEYLPAVFEPWNSLAKEVPELIRNHEVRNKVHKLPLLDHTLLNGHKEKRLAHLQLVVISAGYMWQEGLNDIPEFLPSCLAVPLCALSEELDVPPGIGYSNLFQANFNLIDPNGGLELENLRILYSPTDHDHALNFMKVVARIELDYAPAVKGIEEGIRSLADDDHDGLIGAFKKIQPSLVEMRKSVKRFHSLVDPALFGQHLVPYFTGYGDETSPIKDGLVFQGVSNKPILFPKATGAQTPTLPSLDAFLGLETFSDGKKLKLLTRKSIPIGHRKFIETLEAFPSIKDYVDQSSNELLKAAYNDLISELAFFRSYHIQVVAKYAISAAIKGRQSSNVPRGESFKEGGAYPMPLLKQMRNETREQKCAVLK